MSFNALESISSFSSNSFFASLISTAIFLDNSSAYYYSWSSVSSCFWSSIFYSSSSSEWLLFESLDNSCSYILPLARSKLVSILTTLSLTRLSKLNSLLLSSSLYLDCSSCDFVSLYESLNWFLGDWTVELDKFDVSGSICDYFGLWLSSSSDSASSSRVTDGNMLWDWNSVIVNEIGYGNGWFSWGCCSGYSLASLSNSKAYYFSKRQFIHFSNTFLSFPFTSFTWAV